MIIRNRILLLMGLAGVAAGLVFVGHSLLRKHVIGEIEDFDKPLSRIATIYVRNSGDPALDRMLARRIEYTDYSEIGQTTSMQLAEKGAAGLRPLIQRLDEVLAERRDHSERDRNLAKTGARLYRLSNALDLVVHILYPDIDFIGFCLGTDEDVDNYIIKYNLLKREIGKRIGVDSWAGES